VSAILAEQAEVHLARARVALHLESLGRERRESLTIEGPGAGVLERIPADLELDGSVASSSMQFRWLASKLLQDFEFRLTIPVG